MSKIRILFSPSEAKKDGGESRMFDSSCLSFPELFESRMVVYDRYRDFVVNGSHEALSRLFGISDASQIETHKESLSQKLLMHAVERYDGVAYEYLGFDTLDNEVREYIFQNTIIFSNLFGPIGAGDHIPNYKLKQGESFDGIKIEEHYKKASSHILDDCLESAFVLDLRAGYYDKFYRPSMQFTTLKFLKGGKVVSHYAKAYRGVILREIALRQIDSKEAFMSMELENLKIREIKKTGKKEEIVYEIQ